MSLKNSADKKLADVYGGRKEGNYAKYLREVFWGGGGQKIEGRPNMGSEVGGGIWSSEKR